MMEMITVISHMKDIRNTIVDRIRQKCVAVLLCAVSVALLTTGCKEATEPSFDYHEFRDSNGPYLMVIGYHNIERNMVIPNEHEGAPILYIYDKLFELNTYIETLDIGGITEIHDGAFNCCTNLRSVNLRNVEEIHKIAFRGCSSLEQVVFPATLREIRDGAFANCEKLKNVYFLGEPKIMGQNIFDRGVTIYGLPGSTVEKYAKEYGYRFIELTELPEYT